MNDRTNIQQFDATDAYKRLLSVSEKMRRGGVDAEDMVNVFLAVTVELVLATSWRENVEEFLRNAAEEYDLQIEESLRELHGQFESERQ